jgi:transposase InsO family protein
VKTARTEIGIYIEWYNQERPHQSLSNQTPNEAFALGPRSGVCQILCVS